MERWKPVYGYDDCYQISDCGRIRSLDREVVCKDGRVMRLTEKILKTYKDGKGYYWITLCNGIFHEKRSIARLVLQTFVGWAATPTIHMLRK